jgi:hypothetical protein
MIQCVACISPRQLIRKGALEGCCRVHDHSGNWGCQFSHSHGSGNPGFFLTTSTFDDAAVKKAHEAHHSIILIDGKKLVELMHQYGVGVQVRHVYEVKEVDEDFFEGNLPFYKRESDKSPKTWI